MKQSERQEERGTTLLCIECGVAFVPKNKNRVLAQFCSRRCLDRNRNTRRLKAAADVKSKTDRKKGPSKHAEKVSRFVFVNLVPLEERPELLRAAARNLGITEEGALLQAMRRNGCAPQQEAARA